MVVNMKQSKIKKIKVSDIKPCLDNPKTHSPEQIEKVKKSILKYGITQPLCCNKNNELIIGHCRHEALKQIDENQFIDIIQVEDLTKKEIKALMLADNKLAEYGEWDDSKLDKIIKELNDTWDVDKINDLTGFDNDFINDIIHEDREEKKEYNIKSFDDIRDKIKEFDKIIFQFSGGKDSSLVLIKSLPIIKELKKEYFICFVDTGVEYPCLIKHCVKFIKEIGENLIILTPKKSWWEIFGKKKEWPSSIFRPCMFDLINDTINKFVDKQKDKILIIRGGKKSQKTINSDGKDNTFQISEGKNILNPIFNMEKEIFEKEIKKINIWEGYKKGFKRTCCWVCPFQRKEHYETMKKEYPGLWNCFYDMAKNWTWAKIKGNCYEKRLKDLL